MVQAGWRSLAKAGAGVLLGAAVAGAQAAAYPEKPVRVIIPSPTGGGTDTSTRILAPKLGEILGQQLVLENRPGASGNIGAEVAARAAPDGYTLLACIASHTSNPAVMRKVSYDLARDFAPIARTVTVPNVLFSHPSLPVKTIKELIAFARARPGELNFASAGLGTNPHLAMELFLNETRLKVTHIPYKGVGPALVDVVAGHVPLMMGNILVASPHLRSGRIRGYGVTSAKRSAAAPELPTIAEAALPGYEADQWYGLLAPAGTPREIVGRLHAAVVQALQDPQVRQRFLNDGAEPSPHRTPEEFGALIVSDMKKWARVVKEAGIRPE
jgi:tripartite-type tricarboxylate transporter receptor subunit TctC